jgi:hypothetical protein
MLASFFQRNLGAALIAAHLSAARVTPAVKRGHIVILGI